MYRHQKSFLTKKFCADVVFLADMKGYLTADSCKDGIDSFAIPLILRYVRLTVLMLSACTYFWSLTWSFC
ncbi:MAG: hypothetical protein ACFC03_02085 [Candidatus Malihini olakiniferum]